MFNPIRTILFFVGNFMEFPHHWNHRMGVLNIRGMPLYILSWLPQQMRETKHNSPLGSEVLTNAQILFLVGPGFSFSSHVGSYGMVQDWTTKKLDDSS